MPQTGSVASAAFAAVIAITVMVRMRRMGRCAVRLILHSAGSLLQYIPYGGI